MALVATNFVPLGPIRSTDLKQFVDLFTGVMVDQPITFKNMTQIGGSQAVGNAPLKLFGVVGQTSGLIETYPTTGAASPTLGIDGLGKHSWSPGSPGALDTFMSRIALQNGHATDTPGLWITPRLEVPAGTFDGAALIDQSVTNQKLASNVGGQVVHEEFMPTNGATVVTITTDPTGVIYVSRNGVVQSTTDGHYSVSIKTFTFSTPFDGTERVSIGYSVGPIGSGGLVDQSVTNVKLAPDTARLNLLVNGGFQIWQRGTGPISTGWTADRWAIGLGAGAVFNVSKVQNGGGPSVHLQAAMLNVSYTHGSAESSIYQTITMSDCDLRGMTITFAMWVLTGTITTTRIRLVSNGTGAQDVYVPVTTASAWQRLTATITVPVDATFVYCQLSMGATCAVYITDATLVVGSVPANYAPLHPADDLARCLRYYELVGGALGTGILIMSEECPAGVLNVRSYFSFLALKAITPTVTKVGSWAVGNCGQPSASFNSANGVWCSAVALAAGDAYTYNGGAGSGLIAEANPS